MVCISKICLFLINFLKNMIEVRLGTNWYVLRIILLELSRQNFLSPVTVPPKITVRELHCGLVYSRYPSVPVLRPLMCFVSLSVGSTINYSKALSSIINIKVLLLPKYFSDDLLNKTLISYNEPWFSFPFMYIWWHHQFGGKLVFFFFS